MCMCGKPTLNGTPGYSWNGEKPHIYPVHPPAMAEGDTLVHDEPGRCGGLDSHSHHFRVVVNYTKPYLLVRHGGGDERHELGYKLCLPALASLDSDSRYWLLQSIHSAIREAQSKARDCEGAKWRRAIIDKRAKVRRRGGRVRVEILPEIVTAS